MLAVDGKGARDRHTRRIRSWKGDALGGGRAQRCRQRSQLGYRSLVAQYRSEHRVRKHVEDRSRFAVHVNDRADETYAVAVIGIARAMQGASGWIGSLSAQCHP